MTMSMKSALVAAFSMAALVVSNGARAQMVAPLINSPAVPCQPFACRCIGTMPSGNQGFGAMNVGIRIVWVDPRVTGIHITNLFNESQTLYAGGVYRGQLIRIPVDMKAVAFASGWGLGCGVAFWTIGRNGQPVGRMM